MPLSLEAFQVLTVCLSVCCHVFTPLPWLYLFIIRAAEIFFRKKDFEYIAIIAFGTGGWDCFHCLCHIDCIMTDIKHGWVGGSCIESWYIPVNCGGGGTCSLLLKKKNLLRGGGKFCLLLLKKPP